MPAGGTSAISSLAAQSNLRLYLSVRPDTKKNGRSQIGISRKVIGGDGRGGPHSARPPPMRGAARGAVRRLRPAGMTDVFGSEKPKISGHARADGTRTGERRLIPSALSIERSASNALPPLFTHTLPLTQAPSERAPAPKVTGGAAFRNHCKNIAPTTPSVTASPRHLPQRGRL